MLRREIDAGRVVAAGMQHHDRAGGQPVQGAAHAGEVEAMRLRLVVRVAAHREPGGFEELAMVFPARVADPDLRERRDLPQEVGADLEPARAADRLDGDDALLPDRGELFAKDELLHCPVVGGETVDRQVIARRRGFQALAFRAPHAFQQRHLARVVVVDADAEVDLLRIRVGNVRLRDAEDRIARCHRHLGKERRRMRCVHQLE